MYVLAASFLHRLLFHFYSHPFHLLPFMFLSSSTQKRYTFIALAITLSQTDPATTRVHKSKTGFGKSVARHLAFIFRPSPSIYPSIHPILPPPLVQISRRCWQRSPLPLLSPQEHTAPSNSTVVLGWVQSTMLSSLSQWVCVCVRNIFF